MRLGLILTIWSVSGYIHAQPISGKVVDSIDGSGLPGATILITGTNDLGVISALDGSFEITHDLEAEDSLTISFVGYHRQVVSYSDMVLDSIVKLRPTALSLSQVTVKADRLVAEEFNLKQIKKLDIYRNPSAKADPLLAVNAMPSSTTIDESANISLRGSPPGETGIFINNVPLYDAVRFSQLNGIGTFSIFSTGIIRDVTVFPGNPPLEFGNVASGVVSLRTNSQQVKANQTSLTISPASFGIQLSRRVNDQSSIDIFGNYQPSGLLTAINSEALNGVREFNSKDLGANFRLITKKRSSLRVFAYGNTERYTFDFKSPSFNGIFHQDKKRAYLVSNYKKNFSQSAVGMDLGISISDNQFSFSSSTRNLYNQDHFIGLYHQLFFKTWSLKYGATRDARQFDLQGTFHQYPYALREEHPTESIGTSHDLALNELYAYARIDVLEKSKLGLGLRKNLTESTSGNYLSYQMNFSWSLTKQLTAIMGAGKYHMSLFNRNLNTKEFVSRYQASLDLKHDLPRFDHQLSLFYKDGSSTVIGENQILGLEYFVQYHIAGKLKGQTSVSSLRVSGSKDLELYDLDYFIKGNFSYELPASVTLAINYSWRQGSEYLQIRETRFDDDLQVHEPFFEENARNRFRDYRIISLHISKLHAVNEKLSIEYFGSVSNVADIKNERSWLYSHDYTTRTQEYFQRRLFYMGFNINFL